VFCPAFGDHLHPFQMLIARLTMKVMLSAVGGHGGEEVDDSIQPACQFGNRLLAAIASQALLERPDNAK
jgi:hypothetical protein